MTKTQMFESIKEMVNDIRVLLVKCDLKTNRLNIPDIKDFLSEDVEDAHIWITQIYTTVYEQAKRYREKLPEQTWENYKIFGTDVHEVGTMTTYLKAVRKATYSKTRPLFFKAQKNGKTKKQK